jgi:hypothetical protein
MPMIPAISFRSASSLPSPFLLCVSRQRFLWLADHAAVGRDLLPQRRGKAVLSGVARNAADDDREDTM